MNGALYPLGVLADDGINPRNLALMNAGAAMLSAGGPSLTPVTFGQVLGQGAMQGMNAYQQAKQAQTMELMRRAQLAEIQRKTREAEEMARIRAQLFPQFGSGSTPSTLGADPDRLEAMGTYLSLGGQAGGATMVETAERLRRRREEAAAVDAMKSRPGVLGAGVTTNSPQGQALLGNLTGDADFDAGVLAAQNVALNSNARIPAQPVQAARPGLYGPLMSSQYVGPTARAMQSQLDATRGISPQQALTQFNALQQQHMTATNQASAGDLRRELAGGQADLRRELAGNQADLRLEIEGARGEARAAREAATGARSTFTQEHTLAEDYGRQVRQNGFTKTVPHFNSAAQYMAGGKFNSSGDQALTYAFVKMNDPNDRVARGDLIDINKLGNIPERLRQWVVSTAQGKELPDRVRQEMFGVMRGKFNAMNEQQIDIENEYEERARRNMLNPSNVVIRHSVRGKQGGGNGNTSQPRVIDFNDLPKRR